MLNSGNVVSQSYPSNVSQYSKTPYIDARILEELNVSSVVNVIIKVKDTTGIHISTIDSKEQQNAKDAQRKEFMKNRINSIISVLPQQEFKLQRVSPTASSFNGNITKKGFDILINNSDIKSIYLVEILQVVLDESKSLINASGIYENFGYDGTGQTVCVIDSGIDYDHPDLGGCLGSGCKVLGGYDYYNGDTDPDESGGHGTHVAGIIASEDSTYSGIAPGANLVALKACNDNGTSCPNSYIINSLDWCYENRSIYNISVVSISMGDGGEYPPSCPTWADDEINRLYSVGIPVIVASGNNAHTDGISYPACSPNATSVGMTFDEDVTGTVCWGGGSCPPGNTCNDVNPDADDIVCASNRGENLDLFAPGYDITSTIPGGGFGNKGGTSMATPHVSGAAALLLQADSTLSPDEIKDILNDTGVQVSRDGMTHSPT